MKVPVKPNASQRKALKAKYKAKNEEAAAKEKARTERFKNDPGAANAVRQMTTKQGHASDPLAPRGGGQTEPLPKKSKSRPKFRVSGSMFNND